jgi:hypothetical protein
LKMFDEKNDIDFRSILEGAEEEVPASVWEGVSAGLDKAARGKVVALWFKRAGIGVAAAAAVAAMLLVQPGDGTMEIVPASDEMIAVVEPEPAVPENAEETVAPKTAYMAQATPAVSSAVKSEIVPSEIPATEEIYTDQTVAEETEEPTIKATDSKSEVKEEWHYHLDLSALEGQLIDPVIKKRKVSFVVSGLTGTNAAQNEAGKNIFKRPDPSPGPAVTGVRQTSTNSTYDIPLSFGAGVRVGISPRWSIGAGMNYSMLSRKFYGTYTKVNEAGVIENSTSTDIRNTQHYIGIPVNAYYDILDSRKVNFYAYAGGTVEKCISDRYDILGTSIVHKEKADGMQWSANLGVGVSFKLGKHLGLYIDPSLRYYFDCDQPHNIRAAQPLMLGFEVGLKAYL